MIPTTASYDLIFLIGVNIYYTRKIPLIMQKVERTKLHTSTPIMIGIALALLALTSVTYIATTYAHVCGVDFTCVDGRMTGGGFVFTDSPPAGFPTPTTPNGVKVTFGLELHCDIADVPNNLEVNWGGHHFHLESWSPTFCALEAPPNPPNAPINFMEGNGLGRLDGVSGAFIFVQFGDLGEPGTSDFVTIVIYDSVGGTLILNASMTLQQGNIQAHFDNK